MRVLQWRPRASRSNGINVVIRFPALGEYAGRARFMPSDLDGLDASLRPLIGQVVEVQFAGIAPRGPFMGQNLYRECPGQDFAEGRIIPGQHLEFLD